MECTIQTFFEPTYFNHFGRIQNFTKEFNLLGAISDIYAIYIACLLHGIE